MKGPVTELRDKLNKLIIAHLSYQTLSPPTDKKGNALEIPILDPEVYKMVNRLNAMIDEGYERCE